MQKLLNKEVVVHTIVVHVTLHVSNGYHSFEGCCFLASQTWTELSIMVDAPVVYKISSSAPGNAHARWSLNCYATPFDISFLCKGPMGVIIKLQPQSL